MKKLASLFVLATFAFTGASHAQSRQNTDATKGEQSGVFGGPLANAKHSTPTPAPAAAAEGKKMVGDAMLASDEKGKNATTSFPGGTTTVYLVTTNVSGAKGDKVRADWVADDAGKALPKGKRFYNSSVDLPDTHSYNPNFHVMGPIKGTFPTGKYHVDLSVGAEKLKTLKFSIQ